MSSVVLCKVDSARRALTFRVYEGRALTAELESPSAELHAVSVESLRPDTEYSYTASMGVRAGASIVGRGVFRTAPSDDAVPVRFAAVGDTGDLPWWYNFHPQGFSHIRPFLAWTERPKQWDVAEWIAAQRPGFFVHLGDIVYWPDLWDAHGEAFFRPFAPVLRRAPGFMVIGNHDLPRQGGPPPFESFFHNPGGENPEVGQPQRNYSFAYGSVRVVVADVTDYQTLAPDRRAWLESKLSSATEPWLVVVLHQPCFSVYRKENPQLRDELWPVLVRHGVDLVLSGDDHHYARFRRTHGGTSPIQLIAGGGGKKLYDFDASDPRLAASRRAWSFLLIEARGLSLWGRALGSATRVLDSWRIDRRTGDLPPNIHADRRARIERLHR